IPAHHGRRRAQDTRRRPGDRDLVAARPAGQAQILRRHRPEDDAVDDARRHRGRARLATGTIPAQPFVTDATAARRCLTRPEPRATLPRAGTGIFVGPVLFVGPNLFGQRRFDVTPRANKFAPAKIRARANEFAPTRTTTLR